MRCVVLLSGMALFLCGCAGTTSTEFTPSAKADVRQLRAMRRVVDSAAIAGGLVPIHNPGEDVHGYQKGQVGLGYDLERGGEISDISLDVSGRERTAEFVMIERVLVLRLKRIDPLVVIESGWWGNPGM